ncbi:DUF2721 domain-containing protein [Methylobacterium gnaphalii]|uniref:DUF2721 domain-containing protein n=1 Tax=Methylobacterium gnaphalii TaxID=1010610 RepID=A0A512JHC9_9HYPH|nr:DUF2721 domain-containing protein [Methylobacterium gnaphalii]GEP09369.1 hypothetical protein MGN01_12140 [Methylobacterium gnaphalii]GJD68149.1 hypothetical protein MMMDOFMJ_1067 [Methylobacterium gnaphalii]GLS51746.1 hypothetical protein GCM10007885_46070 [Methylobacterium gnaphalii]
MTYLRAMPASAFAPDDIAHIIQVALAPAFLLTALATLLNVFSTRLARVADKVDLAANALRGAGPAEADRLGAELSYLRRRSFVLDIAVVLASAGGIMTGIAVLTLFVGVLRDATTTTVLFFCFGVALVCTVAAIAAFLVEILLAGRGIRNEVDRQKDNAAAQAS